MLFHYKIQRLGSININFKEEEEYIREKEDYNRFLLAQGLKIIDKEDLDRFVEIINIGEKVEKEDNLPGEENLYYVIPIDVKNISEYNFNVANIQINLLDKNGTIIKIANAGTCETYFTFASNDKVQVYIMITKEVASELDDFELKQMLISI